MGSVEHRFSVELTYKRWRGYNINFAEGRPQEEGKKKSNKRKRNKNGRKDEYKENNDFYLRFL